MDLRFPKWTSTVLSHTHIDNTQLLAWAGDSNQPSNAFKPRTCEAWKRLVAKATKIASAHTEECILIMKDVLYCTRIIGNSKGQCINFLGMTSGERTFAAKGIQSPDWYWRLLISYDFLIWATRGSPFSTSNLVPSTWPFLLLKARRMFFSLHS